jgi:hypothetical protein
MGPIGRFFAGLPQDDFNAVRAAREVPGADQARLAVEDRRAFSREFVRENPVLGPLAIGILAPAEQVAKAAMSLVPTAEAAPRVLGRSGFSNPLESVGAAYTGALQGLNDRGLFGPLGR